MQGQDRPIVFYILTVNRNTDPGHVASRHRTCVGVRRHTDFLFVVGDIRTIDVNQARNRMEIRTEEGRNEIIEVGKFKEILIWSRVSETVGRPGDDSEEFC
jgi:hypothetical protein